MPRSLIHSRCSSNFQPLPRSPDGRDVSPVSTAQRARRQAPSPCPIAKAAPDDARPSDSGIIARGNRAETRAAHLLCGRVAILRRGEKAMLQRSKRDSARSISRSNAASFETSNAHGRLRRNPPAGTPPPPFGVGQSRRAPTADRQPENNSTFSPVLATKTALPQQSKRVRRIPIECGQLRNFQRAAVFGEIRPQARRLSPLEPVNHGALSRLTVSLKTARRFLPFSPRNPPAGVLSIGCSRARRRHGILPPAIAAARMFP